MSTETSSTTTPSTAWGRFKHSVNEWAAERDMVLMTLLGGFLLGGMAGTIGGAAKLFPFEMAVVVGVSITLMLFALEAGAAGRHAPVKRWIAILALSAVSVYAQVFLYYSALGSDRDALNGIDKAAQQHAELVDTIYAPRKNEARRLQQLADAKYTQSDAEKAAGGRTGAQGYGPVARELRRQGDEYATQAAELTATIEDLKAFAEFDPGTVGPEGTYERDLKLWQSAPPQWKEGVTRPEREFYIDAATELGLMMPIKRLQAGDEIAQSALAIAALIDGMALFLGLAIEIRKKDKRPTSVKAGERIIGLRQTMATVRHALTHPVSHEQVRDPEAVLHLRLTGEPNAANFANTLYRAIHPLSGRFNYDELARHENESYADGARWAVDALRANGFIVDIGTEDEEDAWRVPADQYGRLTSWLREFVLREHAHGQALKEGETPERVLRAVLPERVVRPPNEPVPLMRPLVGGAARTATVAAPVPVTATTPVTPLHGSAVPVVASPGAVRALTATTSASPTPVSAQSHDPTSLRPPMAFARGRGVAHSPAPGLAAPALRVVTPPPPEVVAPAATVEVLEATVEAAPVRVAAPGLGGPTLLPVEEEIATVVDPRELAEPPAPEPEPEPDEEDTHPSLMVDRAALAAAVQLEPEPEPEPVVAPAPAPVFAPMFDEDMWEDRPTATRRVPSNKLRVATQDGSTGMRDDALRNGSMVRLAYMTRPPARLQADGNPHAPKLRAHLRAFAGEALARGGR